MLRLGADRELIGVVYDQVGAPTNAADLADAILHIIKLYNEDKEWHKGIYHYSNEGVCSWYDFAHEIMKKSNIACKVNPILTHEYPLPAPRPQYSVMNKQKIKNTFNLTIPHWTTSLDKALKIIQE